MSRLHGGGRKRARNGRSSGSQIHTSPDKGGDGAGVPVTGSFWASADAMKPQQYPEVI